MQPQSLNFLLAQRRKQVRDAAISDTPAIARPHTRPKPHQPKVAIGSQWPGGAIRVSPALYVYRPKSRIASALAQAARIGGSAAIAVGVVALFWLSSGGAL